MSCRSRSTSAAGSLSDVELPSQVADALVRHGVTAEHLELEITETSLLGDPVRVAARKLHALSDGVTLSVDDFGTGYASLAYLTELPVDVVKIDQSFIRDLSDAQPGGDPLLDRAGQDPGARDGRRGVEDPSPLDMLHSLGCDLAQGYHFSGPLPVDDFARWIERRSTTTHLETT